jgi:hypothetical protein
MATNFPGGIDTFVNPNSTSSLDSPSHAGLHTDMGDAITAIETDLLAGWITYTPTWATAGTQPSFGNAVVSGRYKKIGKTILFSIDIVFGSTTTFGTSSWRF